MLVREVEERPYADGCCVRCSLIQRARHLIGDTEGPLAGVYHAIVTAPQPHSAHNWLRSGASAAILAEVAAGALPLTHEALDAHPQARAANFLRCMLVANGALAARDDALVRLETWAASRLDQLSCPEHRRILGAYARWRVLRRARQRGEAARRPRTPTRHAKTCLLSAIAFMAFLDRRGTTLARSNQDDVDVWLVEGPRSAPEVADFLDWAAERRIIEGVVVTRPGTHHAGALDDDTRWSIVARLLHDDTIDLGDRVAGCLVLLYGQQLSRIVALTRDQVTRHHDGIRLHLGVTSIEVLEPLGALLAGLADSRRAYVGIGSPAEVPWLFPGLDPGRPLTAGHLGERLRRLGIGAMPGRRAALVHLAGQLPAAVLADLLHLAPTTAVGWVRAAGGDWNTYAAQLARAAIANADE
ncbi:MAG: hypothetical protein KY452_11110 [Actinobacteria bacterium]|nr:hypothetical protein [Actinomycetota bacterium]